MCEHERRIIANVRTLAEEAIGNGRPEEIRLAKDILTQLDSPTPPLADLIVDRNATDPKPGDLDG